MQVGAIVMAIPNAIDLMGAGLGLGLLLIVALMTVWTLVSLSLCASASKQSTFSALVSYGPGPHIKPASPPSPCHNAHHNHILTVP